jgi:hypothetical protein
MLCLLEVLRGRGCDPWVGLDTHLGRLPARPLIRQPHSGAFTSVLCHAMRIAGGAGPKPGERSPPLS